MATTPRGKRSNARADHSPSRESTRSTGDLPTEKAAPESVAKSEPDKQRRSRRSFDDEWQGGRREWEGTAQKQQWSTSIVALDLPYAQANGLELEFETVTSAHVDASSAGDSTSELGIGPISFPVMEQHLGSGPQYLPYPPPGPASLFPPPPWLLQFPGYPFPPVYPAPFTPPNGYTFPPQPPITSAYDGPLPFSNLPPLPSSTIYPDAPRDGTSPPPGTPPANLSFASVLAHSHSFSDLATLPLPNIAKPHAQQPARPRTSSPPHPPACRVTSCTSKETFCILAPCGCPLCRDHLKVVLQGVKPSESDAEDADDSGSNSSSSKKRKKRFKCAACMETSEKAEPSATPSWLDLGGAGRSDEAQSPATTPPSDVEDKDQLASEESKHEGGVKPQRTFSLQLLKKSDSSISLRREPSSADFHFGAPFAIRAPDSLQPLPLPLPLPIPVPFPLPLQFLPPPPSPYPVFPHPQQHHQPFPPLPGPPQPPHIQPHFAPPSPPHHAQHGIPLPPQASTFRMSGFAPPSPQERRTRALSTPTRPLSFSPQTPSTSPAATPNRSPLARFTPLPSWSTPNSPGVHRSVSLSGPPGNGLDGGIGMQRWKDPRGPKSDPSEPYQLAQDTRWPCIKIENIPFTTTVADLEHWLPPSCLPSADNVISSIHIILHRATGRTLPHCYLEMESAAMAQRVLALMDRAQLGDRTIRIKWERPGELMRDLFSQSEYFATPSRTPASAPLPPAPVCFILPPTILYPEDFQQLIQFCLNMAPWRERPFERPFLNIVSLIAKFPWACGELWTDEQRDELFECGFAATTIAIDNTKKNVLFYSIVHKLSATIFRCPGFTEAQKDKVRALNDNVNWFQMPGRGSTSRVSPPFSFGPQPPPSPPSPRFDRRRAAGRASLVRPSATDMSVMPRLKRPSRLDLNFVAGTPLETPPVTPPATPPTTGDNLLPSPFPPSSILPLEESSVHSSPASTPMLAPKKVV